ncbi:MAG: signal peptidase II [bacterium]
MNPQTNPQMNLQTALPKGSIMKSPKVALPVLAAIVALDAVTKHLAQAFLSQIHSLTIIPNFFHLTYVENRGAAFGLLAETSARFRTPFFIIVSVLAILFIAVFYWRLEGGCWTHLSLIFILAGALGNLIDRLRLGWVIDFLDFHWYQYHWPAFNVADMAICIGAGILLIDTFFSQKGRTHVASLTL